MMCDAAQMLPDFWTMAVGVNQRELKAHRGHSLCCERSSIGLNHDDTFTH